MFVGLLASSPCLLNHAFSAECDGSLASSDVRKETGSKKRGREPGSATSSKACREKLRRDKLNDKYAILFTLCFLLISRGCLV
ncbi:hypothetical protein Hanom_Chr08g00738621 [Helianthus anomalus]